MPSFLTYRRYHAVHDGMTVMLLAALVLPGWKSDLPLAEKPVKPAKLAKPRKPRAKAVAESVK